MKAACMNAVPDTKTRFWYRCGWTGDVKSMDDECPRCLNKGRLAPVVEVPAIEEEGTKTIQDEIRQRLMLPSGYDPNTDSANLLGLEFSKLDAPTQIHLFTRVAWTLLDIQRRVQAISLTDDTRKPG